MPVPCKESGILGGMSALDKSALLALGSKLKLPPGAFLFLQGDPGSSLYSIHSGVISICTLSPDGRQVILQNLAAGDILGEISLFDREGRTASAFTKTGAVLVVVERAAALGFFDQRPRLYHCMISLLCQRLRWSSGLVESFAFSDSMERLVTRLLLLAVARGGKAGVALEVSQEHLAKALGLTRETVNKNLRQLQRQGLVQVKRKKLTIPSVEGLAQFMAAKV